MKSKGLEDRANNLLIHADIKKDENLLILCEAGYSDQRIANAIAEAAKKKGATPTILQCKPLLPGGAEEPPRPVAAAMKSSDVMIELFSHPLDHTTTHTEALFDYGLRYIMCNKWASAVDAFNKASLWPVQVFYEVRKMLYQRTIRHKTERLTDPKGTDLTVKINPYHVTGGFGPISHPGEFGIFPPGSLLVHPNFSGDGVVFYDGYHMLGNTSKPIKMTFENGWCKKIEGGKEAAKIRTIVEGVDNWGYFDELSLGLNPKIVVDYSLGGGLKCLMHSGMLHIGIGDSRLDGGRIFSNIHLDGWFHRASLFLDEEQIVKDGRFLLFDNEELKNRVSKYGSPRELFSGS